MPARKHDFSSSSKICVTISRLSIAFPNNYPIIGGNYNWIKIRDVKIKTSGTPMAV